MKIYFQVMFSSLSPLSLHKLTIVFKATCVYLSVDVFVAKLNSCSVHFSMTNFALRALLFETFVIGFLLQ